MEFFKNIILKKQLLGNTSLIDNKDVLHIAFGIDANFTIGTGVLIYSILQHNKSNMIFHIFSDDIHDDDISRFKKLTTQYNNISIIIYYVNSKNFSNLSTSFIWSQATYYRFLIDTSINDNINKILYLDSDILCINSFIDLLKKDFAPNITLMAVSDYPEMLSYAKKELKLSTNFYFNAGMLFINLKEWKKNNISNTAITRCLNNNFKYYDQDILNILLSSKTTSLNNKYNIIYHLADMKQGIPNDTVFLHYSGSVKPWQKWGQYHVLTPLWLKYKNHSPWKDIPIIQPNTYKQAKFMARMCKRNQHFFKAIYWFLIYSLWKIKFKIHKTKNKI